MLIGLFAFGSQSVSVLVGDYDADPNTCAVEARGTYVACSVAFTWAALRSTSVRVLSRLKDPFVSNKEDPQSRGSLLSR